MHYEILSSCPGKCCYDLTTYWSEGFLTVTELCPLVQRFDYPHQINTAAWQCTRFHVTSEKIACRRIYLFLWVPVCLRHIFWIVYTGKFLSVIHIFSSKQNILINIKIKRFSANMQTLYCAPSGKMLLNLMQASNCLIATKYCMWRDIIAVVSYAKYCSDMIAEDSIIGKHIFHIFYTFVKYSSDHLQENLNDRTQWNKHKKLLHINLYFKTVSQWWKVPI